MIRGTGNQYAFNSAAYGIVYRIVRIHNYFIMVAKAISKTDSADRLSRKILDCDFKFCRRMHTMFSFLEVSTIGELCAIPLEKYTCFRGFKTRCRQELIAFIETEGLTGYFEGFQQWKANNSKQ